MFKYGCQSSYLSRKSFLFGKRARKKSCNCSDSPASLRVGNQWSFLFVVFAGLPLLPFCHFTIVPASPVCSFAGFAAFAVLLFRRFAVLPFRRFVVFMVSARVPAMIRSSWFCRLGVFTGLRFCSFATRPPI